MAVMINTLETMQILLSTIFIIIEIKPISKLQSNNPPRALRYLNVNFTKIKDSTLQLAVKYSTWGPVLI
jgi:hypothetical protein